MHDDDADIEDDDDLLYRFIVHSTVFQLVCLFLISGLKDSWRQKLLFFPGLSTISTVQYSTVSTVQYHIFSTVQYSTVSTVQNRIVSTVQYSTEDNTYP